MNIFIILLLSLDLRARAFKHTNYITDSAQGVQMVVLSDLDKDKCPTIVEPLCGTNGKEFFYFQNKCVMEVKNFELMTQGLLEYLACPVMFCNTNCPKCDFVTEPVCAVQTSTGEKQIFQNHCEVERIMCTTKRAWTVVNMKQCVKEVLHRLLTPLRKLLYNRDCPKYCPQVYKPVCARFMNFEREFSNECELQVMVCRSQQAWYITRQGPCQLTDSNAGYGYNRQVAKEEHFLQHHNSPQYHKSLNYYQNEHKPVCGRWGQEHREFANLYELEKVKYGTNTNWELHNLGPCVMNSLHASNCPHICDKSFEPVCAIFKWKLREFMNQCELDKTVCETKIDWKIAKQGHCPFESDYTPNCPTCCTDEYSPVCGSYNGELKEFINSCVLEKFSCETNTAWNLVKWGVCPLPSPNTINRSPACPYSDKPVCAVFQSMLREFDNMCEMERTISETNANWQLLKNGRCPLISNAGPCFRLCTPNFHPVCAHFNGVFREFFNSCELEKVACETNTPWEFINRGSCYSNQFKRLVENSCKNEIIYPVCAIYGDIRKTFDSFCQLAVEIENSGNTWSILHVGPCSDATSLAVENLNENNGNHPFSQWVADASVLLTTTPATVTSKCSITEDTSLKEHDIISGKPELVVEEEEDEEEGGVMSNGGSSLSQNTDYDEIYRQWKEAQTQPLHSNESQSGENDSESVQIFDAPIQHSHNTDNTSEFNAASKKQFTRENLPAEDHERKSEDEMPQSSNTKEVTKRDNSNRKPYNLAELHKREEKIIWPNSKLKAKNVPLKKSMLTTATTQRFPANNTVSLEPNSSCGKCQQSTDIKNPTNPNDLQQNPKANSGLSNRSNDSHKASVVHKQNTIVPNEDSKLDVNEINPRQGEIYNGVVYKAPVYDAPTYNFIYYPGFDSHHAPHQNSTFAEHAMSGVTPIVPFHPFQFLTSLSSLSSRDFADRSSLPETATAAPTLMSSLPVKLQNSLSPDELSSNIQLASEPSSLTQQLPIALKK